MRNVRKTDSMAISNFGSLPFLIFSGFIGLVGLSHADEGMHPISQIDRIGLAEKGLKLTPSEIFNAKETCLVDGICRVNGCTGSFVSPSGLIITNHHCAYEAIQQASTTECDLLRDGFLASTFKDEIPAKGYIVRVTEAFEDVSDKMLSAVNDQMDFNERAKALERRQKELEKEAEATNPGMRAEVAEMFTGKTYVRFLYTFIKDVRLVFAPPEAVGKFGGDVDNWEWPRHTGDFSFMRAYVSPSGASADYSPDNVPYKPKRFIPVAPNGINEGDFVMLIGYPGRTARHKTARYLQYLQQDSLPFIVELNQKMMGVMNELGTSNRGVALKNLGRYQNLANVEKRSRGQLKGLANTSILADRIADEEKLQAYINADPIRQARYGKLIKSIANVYDQMSEKTAYELNFSSLRNGSLGYSIAVTLYEMSVEKGKSDLDREPLYMERNLTQTTKKVLIDQQNYNIETDQILMDWMVQRLSKLDEARFGKIDTKTLFEKSKVGEAEFIERCLKMSAAELEQSEDPFMQLAVKLYPEHVRLRELNKSREGELNKLYGELISIKQEFQKTSFVPDANGTLRLTHGTVRGYSPADAIQMQPFTTLSGMIAKSTGTDPFIAPQEVVKARKDQNFKRFKLPNQNEVPVAFLYDTDTTGGNSGSPVINAKGELVGVNFDRTFEATINDFAWNTNYSRSIGVDIRYALWITGVVYEGRNLLAEMGVNVE